MIDGQNQSAVQNWPRSTHPWRCIATDLGFTGAICAGALLALPIMYAERFNDIIWGLSVFGFVGVPLFAGTLRGKTSLAATLLAGMLLLACPVVYMITDPLPVRFELLRDTFFLATASTLTYVITGWTVSFAKHRQWTGMLFAVALDIVAASSIAIMVSIFMYLE